LIRVFPTIEALVRDMDQAVSLFSILWIVGNAMIHGDANSELQGADDFGKNGLNATAQGQCLVRISLRKKKSEFVSADAEGRV
jgi:hypothetical protein